MMEDEAASALVGLNMDIPPAAAGGHTEEENESHAQKRRARCKRARDSAHKLRRSTRLMEKEEPSFECPEDKAARVQQAKFDFSGASCRLRNAISFSYLITTIPPMMTTLLLILQLLVVRVRRNSQVSLV
jgi:hypothetical protein